MMPRPSLSRTFATAALAASLGLDRSAAAQGPQPVPPAAASQEPDAPRLPAAVGPATAVPTISFDESVRRALARNPTAVQAHQEVARFHALMEEVRAASLPTLTGIGTYTRLDADRIDPSATLPVAPGNQTVTIPTGVVEPKGVLNLELTLNVPIVSARNWLQWGQASDEVDVARANEADVRRSVAVATARAYLSVITQKRLVDTARIARDNAKAHYDFTHAQREGGVGNRLDEVRAAQELTTEEVNLQNELVALTRAREALGFLVAGDVPLDSLDEGITGPLPSFNEAMNAATSTRTDVVAREHAERAAARVARDSWADYVPYLNLLASPFYQTPATPAFPQTGWQASLVLTVPFYDGGLRYGLEHERQALADEATSTFDATLRQARSDVRVAFEEMRRGDVALDQAEQSAQFARHALDLATEAYKAGATTNIEVIDAEREARDAETQAAIAEDAARQARLDVVVAAGSFP